MSLPPSLFLSSGQAITLGKELGRGGEGIVYELQGAPTIAAKIYHKDRAAARAQKIIAMTSAKLHSCASNVAFPTDSLFDKGRQFVGFTMSRIGGQQPVHNLYSPTSRKTPFRPPIFNLYSGPL
jgi:DNA-binding helix-hairpin-helix protein with protein kinase domain